MKKTCPQKRVGNLVQQEVDGEILIYDLNRNKALCLNHTSALVWLACDGKRTIAEINCLLGKQLNAQTSEDIVWLALDQLSKEKLIDPPVDFTSRFEGMSRREVVRKIGFTSAVALPLVASLVAPSPLMAQSGCIPNLGACTPLGTACCSMTCANICCVGSGTLQNGENCGDSTLAVPGGICPPEPVLSANCDQFGGAANCCSGNAAFTPGSCFSIEEDTIDFECNCVP